MSSNAWNDFQHDHAGEELSSGEMSEMYHAEQDGGGSSAELTSTADITDTGENATESDSGLMFGANPNLDTEPNNSNSHEDAESEAYNQDEESTNSGNPWNDFQHDHAGEELSSGEMSEMYHAEQNGGGSSAELTSAVDMTDTGENTTERDSGLMFGANPNLDTEPNNSNSHEDAESEAYNQDEESTTSGNPWNDFQREHAGEGHSQAEMSEMYRVAKNSHESEPDTSEVTVPHNDEESISSSGTPLENTETDSSTNRNPDDDIREPSKDESSNLNNNVSTEGNQWNDFQHQHKGEEKTSSELSDMYYQHQQEQPSQQPQQEEIVNNAQEDASQSAPNEWNKFQHEHKDQDLTQQEMSAMYQQQQEQPQAQQQQRQGQQSHQQQQQEQQKQTVNNAQEGESQSTLNEWNKFQHEHNDQDLTQQEMSAMYQQQQKQPQAQQQQQGQQKKTVNDAQEDASQSAPNEWNKFQHEHKDQYLTQEEMSAMYQQQQQEKQSQQQERVVNNLQQDAAQSVPNESNKSEHVHGNQQSSSKEIANSHNQQNQTKQKPKASVQWNLFQHLYGGKGLAKQEMSSKYNEFKENERTFHWNNDFQLVLTSDGKLQNPDSLVGHEAIKTGLFDDQNCLRRRGDLPFSIFQAKMFAMGNTDRSKISSMYLNNTGSTALRTANLRQDSYKQHAAVGTTRRDPDHILELQVVAPELHKEHLDEENFHTLRCVPQQ